MAVVSGRDEPVKLLIYSFGAASGMLLYHLLQKYALSVRATQAFQDVQGILDDAAKKSGRVGSGDSEYVLANGIMHGLRYLNLCMDPAHPGSEFQIMCREAEDAAKEPKES